MKRGLILFASLFGVWLLLSGHYTPMLITFGALSCAGVVAIVRHLGILDDEALPAHLGLGVLGYAPWLMKEIVLSNLAVARVILTPGLPIHPRILRVRASQRTDVAKVIYANSITLTPGTVTLGRARRPVPRPRADLRLRRGLARRRDGSARIRSRGRRVTPFVVSMLGVLATMLLALVRAIRGPTVFDRVLAANMFGTKTVLLIAVSGFMTGRPEWLDLAILYALMNFTGMIALLRFSKFSNLADDEQAKS